MSTHPANIGNLASLDQLKAKEQPGPGVRRLRAQLVPSEVITSAGRSLFHERNPEEVRRLKQLKKLERNRRIYRQHKMAGVCSHGRCTNRRAAGRVRCEQHLLEMAAHARRRTHRFQANELCIYCGDRPGFWGKRCVICRQLFAKDPLPRTVRRLIREYLAKDAQLQTNETCERAREIGHKLITDGKVSGRRAEALRLYLGLDDRAMRSYRQVGKLMNISGERVRQLLQASKEAIEVLDQEGAAA